MNLNLVNFLVGYFVIVNLVGISLIWLKSKTSFIKISSKVLNIVFIILSMIGGFIGVLVGAEMLDFERDNKIFKRWIPILLVLEIVIIIFYLYNNYY